jgi:adenylate kinase family enzyme
MRSTAMPAGAIGMRRVSVVGTSGAGKTTFAAGLAARLGVPHVELDALHWEAGWVEAAPDVFRERVERAVADEGWVIDGGYRVVRPLVWGAADIVVFLDLPLQTLLLRILARTVRRSRTRALLWGTNRESARRLLTRDSLLLWLVKTYRTRQRETAEDLRRPEYRHLTVHVFRSARDAEAWLRSVPAP